MSRLPGSPVYTLLTLPSYLVTFAAQHHHGGQTRAEKSKEKAKITREQNHGVKLLMAVSLGLVGRRDLVFGLS